MINKKMLAGSLGLAFGFTLIALANYSPLPAGAQEPTPRGGIGPAIPAPENWVSFAANSKSIDINNGVQHVRFVGRYYRRSDGSTRNETGPEGGASQVIDIKNISRNRYYLFENGHWQSFPMILPDDGFKPALRREDLAGLEKQQEPLLGFTVYKYTDRAGVVWLKAPDLNFFALRTTFKGTTQEFYDVQLGEQPDDLFEPPKGVAVEEKTEPRGLIFKKVPSQR